MLTICSNSIVLSGQSYAETSAQIPELVYHIPTVEALLAEDVRLGLNARFASPIMVNLNHETAGSWHINDDYNIWQLKILIPQAQGIYVAFDQLRLPAGAELSAYSSKGEIIDKYKSNDNSAHAKYLLFAGDGEETILEYKVPQKEWDKGGFNITKIFHVYKQDILDCHLNAVCLSDSEQAEYGRGVVRVLRYFEQGLAWCSAAVMNNARLDQRPYLLTAYHCVDGLAPDYDYWRFDFNYASLDCSGQINPGNNQQMHGAVLRAGRRESDFLLLELKEKIPLNFQPYFMGWNNEDKLPNHSLAFHHPKGARQKMALDNDIPELQSSPILWSNQVSTPEGYHLVVEFDKGTQETGSSGGPLLNEKGQVIGQLHGGNANCQGSKSYYGRLAKSWNDAELITERLDHWLDPDQTGLSQLTGYSPGEKEYSVCGKIVNQYGEVIPGIEITLMNEKGEVTEVQRTDDLGNYFFTELHAEKNYSVRPDMSNQQTGEIIIKIKGGKRMAGFIAQKVTQPINPISQQNAASTDFLFDRIYPNQIDVEHIEQNLRQLDFTIIRN